MKRVVRNLLFVLVFFLCLKGNGLAQTMYVTDRLYLSLRSVPDIEQQAMAVLPSDTKVEVVSIQNDWAEVRLEDGRTGWVLKRFLIDKLPKSYIIEDLEKQIENKDLLIQSLQEENNSLKKEVSDREMLKRKEAELKKKLEAFDTQMAKQSKQLETTTKERTLGRLKELYVTGIVALFLGLIIGYLLRRPKKKQIFT